MQLDLQSLILSFTFLCNFAIGVYVLRQSRHDKVIITFSLLAFQVALWNMINLISFVVQQETLIILFTQLTILTVLFIPSTAVVFTKLFTQQSLPKYLITVFIPSLLLIPLVFTNYNIIGFNGEIRGDNFIPGLLYVLYAVYFLLFIGYSIIVLWKFYSSTSNYIKRKQAQYILLGISIAGVIGITTNAILPLLWSAKYNVYGTPATILFSLCTAYAITRYRLFDIQFVLRRNIVSLGIFLIAAILSVVLALSINETIAGNFYTFLMLLGLSMVCMQIGVVWFYQKYVTQDNYDFSVTSEIISLRSDSNDALNILSKNLHTLLKERFGIENSTLVLLDWESKQYKSPSEDDLLKLNYNSTLVDYIKTDSKIIIRGELANMPELSKLKSFLKKNKIVLCIPLYTIMEVYGFVFISKNEVNKSNIYSKNSLNELEEIAKYYGLQLEKILMYEAIIKQMN